MKLVDIDQLAASMSGPQRIFFRECNARDYLQERGFVMLPDFNWSVPYGFELRHDDQVAVALLHLECGFGLGVEEEPVNRAKLH